MSRPTSEFFLFESLSAVAAPHLTNSQKNIRIVCILISLLLLVGCVPALSPTPVLTSVAHAVLPTATKTPAPTRTLTSTPTPTPSPTPVPATPTQAFEICSPLEGIKLSEMAQPDLLKNPFQAPRPGMDDGHFGADFAYWSRGTRKTMLGLPVLSVLNGRVAGIIHNHVPYGNAVIIETPLETVPAAWLPEFPIPAPTIQPAPNLYCPPDPADYPAGAGRSLYLLYAHFNQPPQVALGQSVTCGQAIGEVGTTGLSVNPHLHLETRVGPSGVIFPEMVHYDTAATDLEMSTYCTWRVRGLFQAFDPVTLLSLQP
jgi:murein DD-endopeptidase MepM/ murein hydrolase activator NlpD